MQRRHFPRLRINSKATFTTNEVATPCIAENISMGGLFVRTNSRIEIGEKTQITVPLPNIARKECITVDGIAVRVEEGGVAFQFHNVELDTFCELLSFIDYSFA